jgi:hypothetical protein
MVGEPLFQLLLNNNVRYAGIISRTHPRAKIWSMATMAN